MRSIVFTADDFGASRSINAAVRQAHREGMLTHASLMVNGAAFDEAVEIVRENPALGVGVHLTLVMGKATLLPREIPDLTDEKGRFLDSPTAAGLRYFFRPAASEQIRRELRAQIQKFLATDLRPSHLDSHTMIHMHPTIWPIVADLADEFNVPRVRWPRESVRLALRLDGGRLVAKLGYYAIFSALRARARVDLATRQRKPQRTQFTFGLMQTGSADEDYLCALLENLPAGDGAVEIYLHPDTQATTDNPNGPTELAALLSPRVKEILAARDWLPSSRVAGAALA